MAVKPNLTRSVGSVVALVAAFPGSGLLSYNVLRVCVPLIVDVRRIPKYYVSIGGIK